MLLTFPKTQLGPTYWVGENTANHVSDKGLASKIDKRIHTIQQQKQSNLKMA